MRHKDSRDPGVADGPLLYASTSTFQDDGVLQETLAWDTAAPYAGTVVAVVDADGDVLASGPLGLALPSRVAALDRATKGSVSYTHLTLPTKA